MKTVLFTLGLLAGCASPGESLSDAREGWFNIRSDAGSFFGGWDLYYCGVSEGKPVCYKAEKRDPHRDNYSVGSVKNLKEYQKAHPDALFLPNDED